MTSAATTSTRSAAPETEVLGRDVEGEDIPATGGGDVEGDGLRCVELGLQPVRGGGAAGVRGDGCNDDEIDVAGGEPGHVEGLLRCLERQVRRCHIRLGDASFSDPGAGPDPLVVGVEPHGRQVVVVQDAWRDVRSCSKNSDGFHRSSLH